MKQGSMFVLFCFVPMNWDASDCVLGLFGKLSRRGVHGLGFMVFGLGV
jgi:hypothetical protein